MQNRRGPGDVARQFALVDLELADIIERPKPEGRCRGARRAWGCSSSALAEESKAPCLGSPLHTLPARVIWRHLSGQIFRLKEVEKPEDSGLVLGRGLLLAPRQDQANDQAGNVMQCVIGFHDSIR